MGHRPVFAVAVLALAFAGGCARKPDDAALVTKIKSQIVSDSMLKDADLRVNSSKGEVTLAGTVSSDAVRQEAYRVASQTSGVAKVNDQMSVQSGEVASPEPAPRVAATARSAPPVVAHRRREKKNADSGVDETETAQNTPLPEPDSAPTPPTQQVLALPQPTPQPRDVAVPVSSTLTVRMIDGVDSSVNHAGEIFHAALESPLVVDNQIVVPRGADIYVRLVSTKSAGHLKGKSELHLQLLKLEFQGRSYSLYSSTYSVSGTSRGKNTAKKVGGGAALGAIIGAIAAGGAGAAIGAGVGAGTGAVWSGMTKGKQVKVPSETNLDFQLEQPVTVTVIPRPILAAQ